MTPPSGGGVGGDEPVVGVTTNSAENIEQTGASLSASYFRAV